eukprot:64393_1
MAVSALNQFIQLQLENNILKQKVSQLSGLCEHHKSQYERVKAKYEVASHKAKEIYSLEISQLLQHIRNQKQELATATIRCKEAQQLAERTVIEHQQERQSLQRHVTRVNQEIHNLHQLILENDARKTEQINRLSKELRQKCDEVAFLDKTLTGSYEEYRPHRSPSLTAFRITNYSHESISALSIKYGSCSITPYMPQVGNYTFCALNNNATHMQTRNSSLVSVCANTI